MNENKQPLWKALMLGLIMSLPFAAIGTATRLLPWWGALGGLLASGTLFLAWGLRLVGDTTAAVLEAARSEWEEKVLADIDSWARGDK